MPLILQVFCWLIVIESHPKLIILNIIINLIQFYSTKNKQYFLCILFIFVFFIRLNLSVTSIDFDKPFIVKHQQDEYTVFRQGLNQYSGFTKQRLLNNQMVVLSGQFEKQETNHLSEVMALNHTYSGLKIQEITVIGQRRFHQLITDYVEPKLFINHDYQLESKLVSLLISSGLIISTMIFEIRKILNFYFEKRTINFIIVSFNLLLILLLGLRFIFVRLVIKEILVLFNLNRHKRNFFEAILCLVCYPYAYRHLAFLIPFSFKLSPFLFKSNQHLKLKQMVLVVLIQLSTLYQVNLFQTFLFSYFRVITRLLIVLSFVPLINMNRLILFLDSIFLHLEFNLVGKMPWVLTLLMLSGLMFEVSIKKQLALILSSFILFVLIYQFNPSYQMIFIDVNQGDATLFISPRQQEVYLIDTGKSSSYVQLKQSLFQYGISTIDALIITHMDNDHSGNIDSILKDFTVKQLILDKSQLKETNLNYVTSYLIDSNYLDENDNSLVFDIKFLDQSFLFLGDISQSVERDLVNQERLVYPTVLKLAHHGSKTSTDPYVLNKLNPQFVIISSDPEVYGHPHIEVLETLRKYKIKSFQTARDANIQFIFYNRWQFVKTQSHFLIVNDIIGE